MNVVSACPLGVASLRWWTSRGVPMLTVIAKATYRLCPVTCPLAEEQEYPNEYESHWNDDRERSLHSPSDLVPFKPRPEVTLVGQAFAPRGEPVSRLVARLIVGNVDKSVVVHGDRSFNQEGVLRGGPRFARMPLRWERAAGGPESQNPVGVVARPDTLGVVALPNLEPPGVNVTRPDDFIEPVGFGPMAADWPARRMRLAGLGGAWSLARLQAEPLPEGLDPRYFLAAPPDQRLDELRPDERIVLENLHPEHPRLVTSLPGYEPRARIEPAKGHAADLALGCDTLWIDTDRGICTLTWRGLLALDQPEAEGRVVITMESAGGPRTQADPQLRRGVDLEDTRPRPAVSWIATGPGRSPMPSWPAWLASGGAVENEPTPPLVPPAPTFSPKPPAPRDVKLSDLSAGRTGTVDAMVPKDVIEAAIARAEADKAQPPPQTQGNPPWLRPALPAIPATPPPPAPTLPVLPSAAPTPTPWAASPAPYTADTRPPSYPPIRAPAAPTFAPVPPAPPAAAPGRALVTMPEPPKPPARAASPADLRQATERGATAASNAAAAASKEPAPAPRQTGAEPPAGPRDPVRDHVDLLWFDPAALPRIRADRALHDAPPARPGLTWLKEPPGPREPNEARDRRDVLAVLSRGRALDEAGLSQASSAAYQDDGTFAAPLSLIAGELGFDFDEVEALRATLVVTAPFASADKKLREAHGNATEALKSEWTLPGDIAEGLRTRVEEAFVQGQRAVAPGYLESSVERILLEGRRYQKKTIFGEPRLRALFTFPGASPSSNEGGSAPRPPATSPTSPRIPAYLPEVLATKLPLFRRFRAKAIVELRPQEDQYEAYPDALLVLALGRLLRRGG